MTNNNNALGRIKSVTVYEREFDSEGNLIKETETITQYEVPTLDEYLTPPYKWNPFDQVIARY